MGSMSELQTIRAKLLNKANREKIPFLKNYMSTPYAFTYGIKVPDSREIAKSYKNLDVYEMYNLFDELWRTGNHEEMSLAIHILQLYKKKFNRETWEFLKKRLEKARTWDHVDGLATDIISEMLVKGIIENREIKELGESRNPWMRRIAIEATYRLIKQNKLDLTFLLAEKLIYDEDKFVQKGVGWMLREAGKRQRIGVRDFIIRHLDMKPIAFSYATEKMKELREMRKKENNRLNKAFEKLDYADVEELIKKLNINYEGEIMNIQKKDILNKLLEIKNEEEILKSIKVLNKNENRLRED